jgi:hypothetical protein
MSFLLTTEYIKKCVFWLIIFFALQSCREENTEIVAKFKIDIFDNSIESLNFSKIDSIFTFDSTGNLLLSHNLLLRSDSMELFVFDQDLPTTVLRFNKRGQLLNRIASVGNSLGDIPALSTFGVHRGKIEVLSPYGDKTQIFRYSRTGQLLSTATLDIVCFSFVHLQDESYFFYSSYNYPEEKWRLRETKGQKVVTEYFANNYKGVKYPIYEENFFAYGNQSALFFETFNTNLFRVQPGKSPQVECQINIGHFAIEDSFWDAHIMDGFAEIMKQGLYSIYRAFENETFFVIDLRFQREDGALKSLQIFINKVSGQITKNEANIKDQDIFAFPVVLTEDNKVGYTMNAKRLAEELARKNVNISDRAFGRSLPSDYYDNPVIGFVALN